MLADFIPALPVLAGFAVASVILGLTPGPDMTLFLSKTVAQSRMAGLAAFTGAATGLLVHTVLVAAGLSVVLAASVTAFTVLKIAGALYLAFLAVEAVRNGSALALDHRRRQERLPSVYLKGLFVNLLNPKIIVFFMTFLPQFVSSADPLAARKMLFLGVFFILVNIPVCGLLILFAGEIATLLRRSPRAMRLVDWMFATVLAAFAAKLIFTHAR